MRPRFTDWLRLKRLAKKTIDQGTSYVRRWWASKYRRPASDPLFESRPMATWVQEMYEDIYAQVQDIETRLADDTTPLRERTALSGRLRKLYRALGETQEISDDPLADQWERELDAGITPDLNATTAE